MKKNILFVTLLTLISFNSFAQFRIGVEAGANLFSAKYKETAPFGYSYYATGPNTSFVVGGKAGLIAEIGITNNIYLQPGAFYTMKGYTITFSDYDGINYDGKLKANYIEIPINVLYKTGTPETGRFFAGIGPYMAYALSGDISLDASGFGFRANYSESLAIGTTGTDMVKPLDIGANLSLGYELPLGVFFRAQLSHGLYNTSPQTGVVQKNWGTSITAGYLLGFN